MAIPVRLTIILGLLLCLNASSEGRFRVQKCCEEFQHLEDLDCVDDAVPGIPSNSSDHKNESWPWWFPNQTKIISVDSNKFLDEFPHDIEIIMGMQQPCCISETAFLPSFFYDYDFFDDGAVRVYKHGNQNRNVTYPPFSYCVDRLVDRLMPSLEFMVQLCPCTTSVCVFKCCAIGMALNIPKNEEKVISDNNCQQDSGDPWKPDGMDDYFILYGFPQCKMNEEIYITNVNSSKANKIFINGTAHLQGHGQAGVLKFCGETILHERLQTRSTHILSCHPRNNDVYGQVRRLLYGSLSAIGSLFLILTLIVYASLNRDPTVNDKNLIAHTWSLLIGYLGIAITQFAQHHIPHSLCVILGFIILYAFLASFFWLNVLCIDLAWAFSELRLIRNIMVWQNRRRHLQYSLYAWLSPAIIVLATITVDFTPDLPPSVIKPEFATRCWFANDSLAKLAYFYGPIAVLLIANILLFIYTAYKIISAQKQASSLLQNNAANEKKRIILYVKLFCLMGLSWVFELVSWVVGGPDYYWYGTDIINLFRAVFIFVTLCWKKEVLEEVRKKFRSQVSRGRQTASPSVTTLSSQLPNENRSHLASSSL